MVGLHGHLGPRHASRSGRRHQRPGSGSAVAAALRESVAGAWSSSWSANGWGYLKLGAEVQPTRGLSRLHRNGWSDPRKRVARRRVSGLRSATKSRHVGVTDLVKKRCTICVTALTDLVARLMWASPTIFWESRAYHPAADRGRRLSWRSPPYFRRCCWRWRLDFDDHSNLSLEIYTSGAGSGCRSAPMSCV